MSPPAPSSRTRNAFIRSSAVPSASISIFPPTPPTAAPYNPRPNLFYAGGILLNKSRYLLPMFLILIVALGFAACQGEEELAETDAFSFVVYPGSRYLGQLTEATKQAHKVM